MNAFALVQTRMKKLESLRLEVDSRRRTVSRMGKRVDSQRAQLPQTRARGEYDMENTIKVLQHKEAKLSACRQSYKEHEALVYHQLTNLIRDTVWLKSYLSAVLRVESEAFQVANAALGSMRAALPAAISASEDIMIAAASGHAQSQMPHHDQMVDEDDIDGMSMMMAPESPDAIPVARSDGAPMPRYGMSKARDPSISITATAATKDSMYNVEDIHGGVHRYQVPAAATAGSGYERYGVSESNYSRAQMAAW